MSGHNPLAFWRPGQAAPGVERSAQVRDKGEGDSDNKAGLVNYNPNASLSIAVQRRQLPIYSNRTALLYLLEKYNTVIVVGQTGCGKTTQIPQYLHEAGWSEGNRVVVCTQPRRVAATSVAARVAEEMNVRLGEEVGYNIRFDDCSSADKTRIKFVTDGMLLREMMLDPLLTRYPVIMIDEAHERSIHTDMLLGLLKKIQKRRKDLKLIVSSATVDAEEFRDFFESNTSDDPDKDTVSIMSVEGRMYPVDMLFRTSPSSDYLQDTIDTVIDIHKNEKPGDILVFLTGQEEIETVATHCQERAASLPTRFGGLQVMPMYSGLSQEKQMKVFQPARNGFRKVVIATNIAETSITIDGIVYVVDPGFVKQRLYNPKSGMECLLVQPISRASAMQRAGRAGRVRTGKCFRLYTEEGFYESMSAKAIPEMQRTNLLAFLIQLKALGIEDVLHFDFMSPPSAEAMIRALELLYALGILDDQCKLTSPLGTTVAEFPVEPFMAKMLLSSGDMGCSEEILTVAAMVSVQSPWVYPKDIRTAIEHAKKHLAVHEGDHLTLLNVYNAFIHYKRDQGWCKKNYLNHKTMTRAVEVRAQLKRYMKRFNIPLVSARGDIDVIRKCIVSGFFSQAAQLQSDGSYTTIKDKHRVFLHPSSVMFKLAPKWVVFHELVLTQKEFMREVTAIEPEWLHEMAPHFYEFKGKTRNPEHGTVQHSISSRYAERPSKFRRTDA